LISTVANLDEAIRAFHDQEPVDSGPNQLSKGGMASKLEAARLATQGGENVIIANGRRANVLMDIAAGAQIGTIFLAQGPAIASRKRWIGLTAHPTGKVVVDAGAQHAVEKQGRSLLAVGVTAVEGNFRKGDVVALCQAAGPEFARGLINYSAADLRRIAGHPKAKIVELLGHLPYDEVIHRDNLALTSRE
jgi:glutamate 5-kinase